jgi:DNA-binding protein H-NS
MTDIDLSSKTDEELKALEDAIRRERVKRENARKREAEKKIKEIAADAGLMVEIVSAGGKGRGAKSALPAKYRNPDDPSQTWSGRGKRPAWFKEALDRGLKPEDMLI